MHTRTYPDLATFFEDTGLTQVELADELGISQSYLSRIKTGEVEAPLWLALKIARRTRIPLESLVKPAKDQPDSHNA